VSKCRENGMLLAWSAAIGIWEGVDTLRSAEGEDGRWLWSIRSHRGCGSIVMTAVFGLPSATRASGPGSPVNVTTLCTNCSLCASIWAASEYKVSSYDGPDYWEGMIRRAKKSPYYSNNVIFVMGTDSKLEHVRNADRVMRRAPYVIHDLPQEELDRHATREDLYRWVFGYTLLQNVFGDSITELSGRVHEAGQELAVYEVNWLLSGDILTANNELEIDRPQATLT
jgi:hypothetical protein